jgi:hypothetical protein
VTYPTDPTGTDRRALIRWRMRRQGCVVRLSGWGCPCEGDGSSGGESSSPRRGRWSPGYLGGGPVEDA